MEESKALNRIMEAADLAAMVEEMTSPATLEKLSATSLSGIRITLKNIRELLVASHDVLAADFMTRARSAAPRQPGMAERIETATASPIVRRDLRASLEKVIERQPA
jgi:hypothetical protein